MFIVFEGLDGSGGTTQLRLLAEALKQLPQPPEVLMTTEPSEGPAGRLIREALVSKKLGEKVLPYLFAADRRDHLDRSILPALTRQAVVLSDRYLLSSLAYQRGVMSLEQISSLNADFRAPDATIMIDVPVEVCLERIERRGMAREIFETRERLNLILTAYEAAIAFRMAQGDRILRVDGHHDAVEVHDRIRRCLETEGLWPG